MAAAVDAAAIPCGVYALIDDRELTRADLAANPGAAIADVPSNRGQIGPQQGSAEVPFQKTVTLFADFLLMKGMLVETIGCAALAVF